MLFLSIAANVYAQNIDEQVLVTHPESAITQLTRNNLRSIFAMRTAAWPDGTIIYVYVLPDNHPSHKKFSKHFLGMFPYQLRRIWERQVYSGTGIAPTTVNSLEEMRKRIAQTPGAIGYISSELVDNSVQVIKEIL